MLAALITGRQGRRSIYRDRFCLSSEFRYHVYFVVTCTVGIGIVITSCVCVRVSCVSVCR